MDHLHRTINTPFRSRHEHLAFHLVCGKGEQCVAMTFDHRLFDARGAEAFMNLFQEYLAGGEEPGVTDGIRLTQKLDLREWQDKLLAGQTVNRKMIALSRETIRAFPVDTSRTMRGFRHRIVQFDRQESAAITERAFDVAGYLLIMPYLLAEVCRILHPIFAGRGVAGTAYVVPASTDLRQGRDIREELFFNHNSMFFFQVMAQQATDRDGMVTTLKEQLYEQVAQRFPRKLMTAASLTRIAPLGMMRALFHLPLQGKIASFCFSHVSKCAYSCHDLMGARIVNVFHMPRMPVPPGIGIFFNTFDGRLNATIAWLEGSFSEDEVDRIEAGLRSGL
jgi:hypothetical protein